LCHGKMNRLDRIVAGAKAASVWKKAVWTVADLGGAA